MDYDAKPTTTTPPSEPVSGQVDRHSHLWLFIILFVASVISSFIAGYYWRVYDTPTNRSTTNPIASSAPVSTEDRQESIVVNLPRRAYFDDTIMAITDERPRRIVVATVTREDVEEGSYQATRASYFDGKSWTRKILTGTYANSDIATNTLVTNWDINIDPTLVLKQSATGTIRIDGNTINFDTGLLTNNIGMRSLPGYTKFMSTSDGQLTINETGVRAKILYTRIYSHYKDEMEFFQTSVGLTTNWIALWDEEGNFYHIDKTVVDQPTTNYQTHQVGVKVDAGERVTKTYDVSITSSSETPPRSYTITLGHPINQVLSFTSGISLNKAPNTSYDWFMSEGVGIVDGTPSYGAAEYIHN